MSIKETSLRYSRRAWCNISHLRLQTTSYSRSYDRIPDKTLGTMSVVLVKARIAAYDE